MAASVGVSITHFSRLEETASILVDNAEAQFELITGTPGAAASSSITAVGSRSVVRVAVQGVDVWVRIGAEAGVGDGFLVLAGTVEYFAANVGDNISVYEPV
jgi:hypothetical protein